MENREEIMGEAMDEMIYLALEELRIGNEEVRKAAAERLDIRDRVSCDPDLDGYGRKAAQRYLDLLDEGARGCVLLLRRLGVIR